MTSERLPTRRELREAQLLGGAQAQPSQSTPPAAPRRLEPPPTRRQIREMERAQDPFVALTTAPAIPVQPPVAFQPALPALVQVVPQPPLPVPLPPQPQPPVPQVPEALPPLPQQFAQTTSAAPQPWSLTDTGSIFTMSPTPGAAPQTASIVIAAPVDPLSFTGPIFTSGDLPRTGSITIPSLGTATAEVSLAKAANDADLASALDSSGAYVAGIPPIAAAGVIRSRSKDSAFPQKLRRGKGQLYLVLTTVLLMATVLGLTLAAFLLGIFN